MPDALLYPLDRIHPDQLLAHYSDWIYFTLVLVFFISLAGITLRKHFDRPYVKPLIISVGIMLTVGVFMYKQRLVQIFQGWGIVGLILLVVVVATIPYNLCRGYGVSGKKAFYLTYILFYIVAWISYPTLFYGLADQNLGLVNLGLLAVFIVAIFKMIPLHRSTAALAESLKKQSPLESEIQKNINVENAENHLLKSQAGKVLNFEVRTLQDMAEALAQIQRLVESRQNNLSSAQRKEIADFLENLSKSEDLFNRAHLSLRKTSHQINVIDEKQLKDLKGRMEKATEKERQIIKAEIEREEEKLKIQSDLKHFEDQLPKSIEAFNQSISSAVENMKAPQFYYGAKEALAKGRSTLQKIFGLLQRMQHLEKTLLNITKVERKSLEAEKKIA
jgi:hypothetical protein